MNKKKIIIITAAAVVIAAALIAIIAFGTADENKTEQNTQAEVTETEPKNQSAKPTEEVKAEKADTIEAPKQAEKADVTEAPKQTEEAKKNSSEAKATAKPQEKVYTPTFMYFVSPSKDENHADTMKMLDELKKEYEGKVNFDIRDIDANPENVKNFPVEGQTPVLIMLNTKNDICAWSPKCSDKSQLKSAIDGALG